MGYGQFTKLSYVNIVFSRLLSYNLSALALGRPAALSLASSCALLAIHALGLGIVAQLLRAPLWLVGVAMALFVVAQFISRAREIFSPALLAPFWLLYAALLVRFAWIRIAGGVVPGYFEYAPPDLRALLRFEFIVGAAFLYSALIFAALMLPPRARALRLGALGAVIALFVWASAEYLGHRAFGATGSDPFGYVQMGVDLYARGSFAHRFELFSLVAAKQIEWFPLVHVGYRLPFNALGDAITVWPPGGAVAFALAYALGGESALYVVNPLFSILSAGVSALLACELARRETTTRRIVIASCVSALLLTSYEIVNWAGVTMVDTQALVFSTLAFYGALRVYRDGAWQWALLAGICWGAAYQARHTQLALGVGMLPLFFDATARVRNVFILCASALIVALPDLWYHQMYLGSWLAPESEELALFAFNAILPTLWTIGARALTAAEFGWLIWFALPGIYFYTRRARLASIALLLWLNATLWIHLPYAALRLRDLIPQFPIVAFYIAFGSVTVIGALWARQRAWASFAAASLIFLALELNLARVWHTLPRVTQEPPPRFGAMSQTQRASFDAIAQLTPENAIVGASLNSGALDLYARRRAFRPADWSTATFREFILITQDEKRAMYLLEDNASLARVLDALRGEYRIERVTTLDVPLFGDEPVAHPGALWKITRR